MPGNIIFYSKKQRDIINKDINESLNQDFTQNEPEQALVDFKRQNYLIGKKEYHTQEQPNETGEQATKRVQQAQTQFFQKESEILRKVKARGGQAMDGFLIINVSTG